MSATTVHAQWTLETSNTTADLRGIDKVSNGIAWASGTGGTVLRTLDSGKTWTQCAVPPNAEHLDFRGIQAFDTDTAIVMSSGKGDLSRLYKTTDGCRSWKLIFTNPDKDGFWDALRFDRRLRGWLLGDPVKGSFVIFATDDVGRTWTEQHNAELRAQAGNQGVFAASNSSLYTHDGIASFVTGGTAGAFFYSIAESQVCLDDCSQADQDREGRRDKWEHTSIPVGNATDSSGVFSIAETSSVSMASRREMAVAVGGDYLKPDAAFQTAAFSGVHGSTWTASQTMPHGYRSSVAYDADIKTWITVGPNGTDISTDDGRNWRAVRPNPALHETPDADRNWNALSLPYVVGPHGRIGHLDPDALKTK